MRHQEQEAESQGEVLMKRTIFNLQISAHPLKGEAKRSEGRIGKKQTKTNNNNKNR